MLKKLLPIFALTAGLLLAGCTGGKGGQGGSQGGGEGSGGSQGGGGEGGAQTVEIVSQMGDSDEAPSDATGLNLTRTVGAITVSWNGAYKHFPENNEVRIYAGQSMTISGATITKIDFTFSNKVGDAKGGPDQLSAQGYTYPSDESKTGTWSGSATSITFSATKQAKIWTMTVTYTA